VKRANVIRKCTTDKWADDRGESKYGPEHAEQPGAVLEASNLGDNLYHGYNYFVPVCQANEIAQLQKQRTHACCSHPANRSPHNKLVHMLCYSANQRTCLENGDGPYEDPFGGENA
jgi:hypothetical protein